MAWWMLWFAGCYGLLVSIAFWMLWLAGRMGWWTHSCWLAGCYGYVLAMCLLCACYVLATCLLCVCYVLAMCLLCTCYVLAICLICACYMLAMCLLYADYMLKEESRGRAGFSRDRMLTAQKYFVFQYRASLNLQCEGRLFIAQAHHHNKTLAQFGVMRSGN